MQSRHSSFNPRTLRVRLTGQRYYFNRQTFRSTHPCGCDNSLLYPLYPFVRFNPRTPAECDPARGSLASPQARFQSTHPCGATSPLRLGGHTPQVSIHAPLRVRLHKILFLLFGDQFQSTHPCGCGSSLASFLASSSVSIHAPCGSTPIVTLR